MSRTRTMVAIGVSLAAVVFLGTMCALVVYRAGSHSPGTSGGGLSILAGDRVGVLPIEGVILDGLGQEVIEQLEAWEKNDAIKAIVLRINSPGGAVGPSQEIYEAVLRTKKEKTVVVSMGDLAASGGYYIAAGADLIVANPGTLTGSIGVIIQFINAQDGLKKLGIDYAVVKSGKYKDLGSINRPMTPDERRLLQGLIDDVYEQFVEAVAKGRNLEKKEVYPLADGRIFTGRQAKDKGLVDELGDLKAAVRYAGRLGGIEGEPAVVYPAKRYPTIRDFIFGRAVEKWIHDRLYPRLQLRYIFSG